VDRLVVTTPFAPVDEMVTTSVTVPLSDELPVNCTAANPPTASSAAAAAAPNRTGGRLYQGSGSESGRSSSSSCAKAISGLAPVEE
jgi:hypothetical protein